MTWVGESHSRPICLIGYDSFLFTSAMNINVLSFAVNKVWCWTALKRSVDIYFHCNTIISPHMIDKWFYMMHNVENLNDAYSTTLFPLSSHHRCLSKRLCQIKIRTIDLFYPKEYSCGFLWSSPSSPWLFMKCCPFMKECEHLAGLLSSHVCW